MLKKCFKLACEGGKISDLADSEDYREIVAYRLYDNQLLDESWSFWLVFRSGKEISFSSTPNMISADSWEELGNINCSFYSDVKVGLINAREGQPKLLRYDISPFSVSSFGLYVYDAPDVYIESGLFFKNPEGEEIVIVSAVSPGSVFIKAPFNQSGKFNAELDQGDYAYVTLSDTCSH